MTPYERKLSVIDKFMVPLNQEYRDEISAIDEKYGDGFFHKFFNIIVCLGELNEAQLMSTQLNSSCSYVDNVLDIYVDIAEDLGGLSVVRRICGDFKKFSCRHKFDIRKYMTRFVYEVDGFRRFFRYTKERRKIRVLHSISFDSYGR